MEYYRQISKRTANNNVKKHFNNFVVIKNTIDSIADTWNIHILFISII